MYNIVAALLAWPCVTCAAPTLPANATLPCDDGEKYFSVEPRYLELDNVIGNLTRAHSFVCVAAHIRREASSVQEAVSDIVYHEEDKNERRLRVYIGNLTNQDRLLVLERCHEWCSATLYGKITEIGQDDFTLVAERIELAR